MGSLGLKGSPRWDWWLSLSLGHTLASTGSGSLGHVGDAQLLRVGSDIGEGPGTQPPHSAGLNKRHILGSLDV